MTKRRPSQWQRFLVPDWRDDYKQAARIAQQVESAVLDSGWRSGEPIGSMKSLEDRFSIGRSVAQEVIRLLEVRGVVRLQRGQHGGLLVSRPRLDRVALTLSLAVLLQEASIANLLEARRIVDASVAGLFRTLPQASRMAFRAAETEFAAAQGDRESALSRHYDLRHRLARHVGNPALLLFTKCLNQLTLGLLSVGPAPAGGAGAIAAFDQAFSLAVETGDEGEADRACREIDALALDAFPPADAIGRHVEINRIDTRAQPVSKSIEIARLLSQEVLGRAWGAEERIGSEDELCEKFGVGRLTFRQAVRVLEEFEVAEMRAGRGNGLFPCARPSHMPAVRMAHCFLGSRQLSGQGWWQAMRAVQAGLIDSAITAFSPDQREALRPAVMALDEESHVGGMLDREMEIIHRISRQVRNPLLYLFWQILLSYRQRVSVPAEGRNGGLCDPLALEGRAFLRDFVDGRAVPGAFYALLSLPLHPELRDWVTHPAGGEQPAIEAFMPLG